MLSKEKPYFRILESPHRKRYLLSTHNSAFLESGYSTTYLLFASIQDIGTSVLRKLVKLIITN